MSFTYEHIEILEKYREHYNTLVGAGYMRNLDEPVKRQLQQVYWEAIGPQRFTLWCNDCVADLVRQLYTIYLTSGEAVADETATPAPIVVKRNRRPSR